MDQALLAKLKQNIIDIAAQKQRLKEETKKFCTDNSVPEDTVSEVLKLIDDQEAFGLYHGDIALARWKARASGREFNAKVFAEKYLGREVNVDARYKTDKEGIGIVSGYVELSRSSEPEYVILEMKNKAHSLGGRCSAGEFDDGGKRFILSRAVAHYNYWKPTELVLLDTPAIAVSTSAITCECGSTKAGSPIHSSWCPKF